MVQGPVDDHLEMATLRLINAIAFASSTPTHTRRLRAVTGLDLPPSDVRILELLTGREPVATGTVARELAIDLGQASRQAAQLERAGLLVRTTDPADRRRTLVALSEEAASLLDKWLVEWSRDYLAVVASWSPELIADIANWFALVHHQFVEALPDRPQSVAADRWMALAGEEYDANTRFFLHTMINIVTWVSESRGFNDLLEMAETPIRQNGFFTLHAISETGPLSVAEVAERLAIDPSQASKRVTQLSELRLVDRAVDGFDRRSTLIRISRRGATLLARVLTLQLTTFEVLTRDVRPEDRQRWTPLVDAYVSAVLRSRVDAEGRMHSPEPVVVTR